MPRLFASLPPTRLRRRAANALRRSPAHAWAANERQIRKQQTACLSAAAARKGHWVAVAALFRSRRSGCFAPVAVIDLDHAACTHPSRPSRPGNARRRPSPLRRRAVASSPRWHPAVKTSPRPSLHGVIMNGVRCTLHVVLPIATGRQGFRRWRCWRRLLKRRR
jgi:hypothetical protein